MSPPARTPRPDAAGAFGTTLRCRHRMVSDRLLDADAPPSTGRTVARCAAKMRAPSKQVSCSGVRRKVPRRPPKWPRRMLTSRKKDSDRFGTMSQQQAHRRCTEPPDGASPRRRGSACPVTSPKPETSRPAASSHSTRPQLSTRRASRRPQRSPAELEQAPSPCARRCPATRCRRAWPGVATGQSRLEAPMLREVRPSTRPLPDDCGRCCHHPRAILPGASHATRVGCHPERVELAPVLSEAEAPG